MAKSKKKAAAKSNSSKAKSAPKPKSKVLAPKKAKLKKAQLQKAPAKKAPAKKAQPKKVVAQRPSAKKSSAKKSAAKKMAPKKLTSKKLTSKKVAPNKLAQKLTIKKAQQKPSPKVVTSKAVTSKKLPSKPAKVAKKENESKKIVAVKSAIKPALQVGTGSQLKNTPKNLPSGAMLKAGTKAINQQMPKPNELPTPSAAKRGSKSAPPMRLSVNDSDIIASAKERYGAKDLANFKKLIEEQRAEASEEFDIISEQMLDTSGEFDADNQSYALHTAEQGTDAMEREKTFLHAQRTSDYIKKLDEALERIGRGTYGICVICGLLIEKERLAAVPITQKHVDCKNKTQAKKLSVDQVFHEIEEQPAD